MNEDIYQMIDTLHARLDDVRAAVDSLESDAPGFAKRLDKLDDSLYLLQLDLEKHAKSPLQENEPSPSAEEDNVEQAPKASASESDEDNESFLSDKAKDNLKDAGKTMAGIYRDGKEVVSELSGTIQVQVVLLHLSEANCFGANSAPRIWHFRKERRPAVAFLTCLELTT